MFENRLQSANLALLGRALHGIQDFYAHTTHVCLLLWKLAPHLAPTVVQGFNDQPETVFDHHIRSHKPVVLRGTADSTWNAKDPVFLPYGSNVANTPLSGGRFIELDTLYTILDLYRRSLLKESVSDANHDRIISLIFALVDFPGKDLARISIDILDEFGDIIDEIGKAFRHYAIGLLGNLLKKQFPGKATAIDDSLSILGEYDSAAANSWARAGRLSYLQHLIEQTQLTEFRTVNWESTQRPLPHHSLLNKDYEPEGLTTDVLRFNVACTLATRATTEILVDYFSNQSNCDAIVAKYLQHPESLDAALLSYLAPIVPKLLIPSWRVSLPS